MTNILQRLKNSSKINGAYPKDIADAIAELESNAETIAILNKALATTSEGNAKLQCELADLKERLYNLNLEYLYNE